MSMRRLVICIYCLLFFAAQVPKGQLSLGEKGETAHEDVNVHPKMKVTIVYSVGKDRAVTNLKVQEMEGSPSQTSLDIAYTGTTQTINGRDYITNKDNDIIAFNLKPATKVRDVYLIMAFQSGDLLLIRDFPGLIGRVLGKHAAEVSMEQLGVTDIDNDIVSVEAPSNEDVESHVFKLRVLKNRNCELVGGSFK